MRYTLCLLPLFVGLVTAPLAGCGDATSEANADAHDHGHDHDHEHGHRPESLHAAVAELTEMRDAIRSAILDGDPEAAHDPLHEAAELLEAIPDIAAETDLPKEEWDAVKAANDELFDAFVVVDKAFHKEDGDKKVAYESVAEKIDAAIEAIRSRLALTGEKPESGDAGHDDHDHDHDDHDHDHDDQDDHDEDASPSKGSPS